MTNHGTVYFQSNPKIMHTSIVGGPFEKKSKMRNTFDYLYADMWMEKDSFEQAQQQMIEKACDILVHKANMDKNQINYFVSGDLTNQITPTTFAAHSLQWSYIGLFSACATVVESLLIGGLLMEQAQSNYIICGSSSHHAAAERQFRFPTEYGGQKPPTAQWTVTGAGYALLGRDTKGPAIVNGTFGQVIDAGETDPFHMGAAMAPAAVDTIVRHFKQTNTTEKDYDLIVTGDLGEIGRHIAFDLLKEQQIPVKKEQFIDCGHIFYDSNQPVHAGGSGAACAAIVTFGHFLQQLNQGKINTILVVATGALHSPLTVQQKMSIPSIAHAITIQQKGGEHA